jgi:hypothetical protein
MQKQQTASGLGKAGMMNEDISYQACPLLVGVHRRPALTTHTSVMGIRSAITMAIMWTLRSGTAPQFLQTSKTFRSCAVLSETIFLT